MNCWHYQWQITRAADMRRAVPAATQAHLAACDDCRAFQALCGRLPDELAPAAPPLLAPELRQRILDRTTHAPDSSKTYKQTSEFNRGLAVFTDVLSSPWKTPLTALAVAALFIAVVLGGWQHWRAVRPPDNFAAVQAAQGLLEKTVASADAGAWPAALGQSVVGEYQKLAEDAAATVDYFSGILPRAFTAPIAVADRSG